MYRSSQASLSYLFAEVHEISSTLHCSAPRITESGACNRIPRKTMNLKEKRFVTIDQSVAGSGRSSKLPEDVSGTSS
ncbi:MAG: hypothetical protein EA424_01605 [Planctomycetaceae bacterium]|nr:MAG: hypothetical protein EA424_01605 [Planctomycetaceae bacterium]